MSRHYALGTFKGKLEIKDKPRLKKRVSNKVNSMFHKASKGKVSNPRS